MTLPLIALSSCLYGENVRYDGGHRRQDTMLEFFDGRVDWLTVCPEFEMGLGVPRDTLHLEEGSAGTRMIVTNTGEDITDQMDQFCASKLEMLAEKNISGYVFKTRSPSCDTSTGLFAVALQKHFPELPVKHEEELQTTEDYEKFLAQITNYQRSC